MAKWGCGRNKPYLLRIICYILNFQKNIDKMLGRPEISTEVEKLERELESAKERIQHLEAIVSASKVINSTLDLDQLLGLILRTAVENTRAEAGTIYLIDEKQGEIWSKVNKGTEKIQIRLSLGEGVAGSVAETGETVNLANAYKDSRFLNRIDDITGFKTK